MSAVRPPLQSETRSLNASQFQEERDQAEPLGLKFLHIYGVTSLQKMPKDEEWEEPLWPCCPCPQSRVSVWTFF